MLKIAIYGKGRIGKSTIILNLSAVRSDLGYRVMQGQCIPTVLNQLGDTGVDPVRMVTTGEMNGRGIAKMAHDGAIQQVEIQDKTVLEVFEHELL